MTTGRSSKLTGHVGELLVCAELGRRGCIATLFSGDVQGFGVMATDEQRLPTLSRLIPGVATRTVLATERVAMHRAIGV